jgi:hypothetical protein
MLTVIAGIGENLRGGTSLRLHIGFKSVAASVVQRQAIA